MKVYLFIFLLLGNLAYSQFLSKYAANEGAFQGGFGLTWIDSKPHYTFRIAPELSFGNIGVGLDLKMEFEPNGSLRKENFNEVSDYLSIIRYFRYGQKNAPLYLRVGALDYATLGNGSIMYLYNNSPSFDARKIGMELDIDFNSFGFESVYGSFGERSVIGLRAFVLPFKFTNYGNIPIIGDFELGFTYAGDFNENAGVLLARINPNTNKFERVKDEGSVGIVGFDIGLPIVKGTVVDWRLYFDYSKILDYGYGTALGTMVSFNGLGLVDISAKLERRFNSGKYIPAYFNSMYELERFNFDSSKNITQSKIGMLNSLSNDGLGNGFFGELMVSVLGYVKVLGSYQRLDKHPESGILHLSSNITPEEMPYLIRAGYDKRNIKDESDLFKLDDRSYFFVEMGYKPYSFLIVSLVYNWTFTPVRDKDDNIISFEPQKRIEPRVSFYYPLKF